MTTERELGSRDASGHWVPDRRCDYGPLFAWPIRPLAIARWFVRSYVWSWQLGYLALAVAVWVLATPSPETMSSWSPGWIAAIGLRNLAIVVAWYGCWHVWLYVRSAHGTDTKYNPAWPRPSRRFTFGTPTLDNLVWSLGSGVPIATAVEVVIWHRLAANDLLSVDRWGHAVWLVAGLVLIPLWREVHFYAVHRALHHPALYRRVHSLHHRNTNPAPWSGLSMHPVEHLAYFSALAICLVVPVHPLHLVFIQLHLLMAPAPGHCGFERVRIGPTAVDTHGYAHYLHHRYVEVNYSDGAIPLDRWFGTFHDGSPDALAAIRSRNRRPRRGASGPSPSTDRSVSNP